VEFKTFYLQFCNKMKIIIRFIYTYLNRAMMQYNEAPITVSMRWVALASCGGETHYCGSPPQRLDRKNL